MGGDPGNVLGPPISPRAVVLGADIDQVKALKVDLSVLLELCLCSLLTARTKLGKVRFRSLKLTSRKGSGLSFPSPEPGPCFGVGSRSPPHSFVLRISVMPDMIICIQL